MAKEKSGGAKGSDKSGAKDIGQIFVANMKANMEDPGFDRKKEKKNSKFAKEALARAGLLKTVAHTESEESEEGQANKGGV